ncbi:hypothetical protein PanWU01x14_245100 [Parasponia andersonii]|uniref:Uncharacterized protein n=1 Tax=Parasponia andersonii TaxID=3476 RepID=A0A2P5BEV9_PARAD|nr:hypothetical protein PanWU01x14_245100 [Parasponia andersonii]
MGTTSFDPSTPQNDCIKLKRFSPTFNASRSILLSAVTSSDGSDARSSTDTPIFAEIGAASEAVIWRGAAAAPGSGQARLRTAEGRVRVTAPQKTKAEPGDWT